jgi:hypothetical protein
VNCFWIKLPLTWFPCGCLTLLSGLTKLLLPRRLAEGLSLVEGLLHLGRRLELVAHVRSHVLAFEQQLSSAGVVAMMVVLCLLCLFVGCQLSLDSFELCMFTVLPACKLAMPCCGCSSHFAARHSPEQLLQARKLAVMFGLHRTSTDVVSFGIRLWRCCGVCCGLLCFPQTAASCGYRPWVLQLQELLA